MGPALAVPVAAVALEEVVIGLLAGAAIGAAAIGVGVLAAKAIEEINKASANSLCCSAPARDVRPWQSPTRPAPLPARAREPDPEPAANRPQIRSAAAGAVPAIEPDTDFRITIREAEELEALSPMSVKISGDELQNSRAPFTFSLVVASVWSPATKSPMHHAALLLNGDFAVRGMRYPYVLVDRWADGVMVRGVADKRAARNQMMGVCWLDLQPTQFVESDEFMSMMPAPAMVAFAHEDLVRDVVIGKDKVTPANFDSVNFTNCVIFAARGGLRLGLDERHPELWGIACAKVLAEANSVR